MMRNKKVLAACAVLAAGLCWTHPVLAQVSAEQRQKEEKAAEQKLTELDRGMQELNAEAKKKESQPQAELNRLYEEFKKQQGSAMKDLETLRKSTNESWEKAKVEMDQSLKNLNGLYERSKAKAGGSKGETK